MNTFTAPEYEHLSPVDNTQEPVLIKEVSGAGNLEEQYQISTGADYYNVIKNSGGGLFSWL